MFYSEAQPSPPNSNTGGKSPEQSKLAFIDWFSVTFIPPDDAFDPLIWVEENLEVLGFPRFYLEPGSRGWQGYQHRIDLGDYGFLAYGGESQNNTYHLSITGTGCKLVKDWSKVRQLFEPIGARITRVDLAHDDFEAQSVSIAKAIDWYDAGGFTSSGRPPKRQLINDFDSGDGKTFYIGARKNGKLCRVYEKGREQGDKASPWVRVEVEFRNKSRIIEWDIVASPGHYLAGAYPCFAFLSAIQCKVKTIQKAVTITYQSLVS